MPIDATTNLVAEPGMQLVIIDFVAPSSAPVGTYTLKLQFSGTTNSIKVVFAAKVTAGAADYYVPIFPCVTNFANVSAIGLPLTNLATLIPIVLSAQGCNGTTYNFAGVGPATIDLNQRGLTGSWFEPATSGQGIEVEVFPNLSAPGTALLQVSWFTYDSVVGGPERQRWYTLGGTASTGQPASLTIYQNVGGNFNAPPITAAQAVGTATLSFDSCTRACCVHLQRWIGTYRHDSAHAAHPERDVLDQQRTDRSTPTSRFPATGTTPRPRAKASPSRSIRFAARVLRLVHLRARRRGRGRRRPALVHRTGNVCPRLAFDQRANLCDDRRCVQRPRQPCAEHRRSRHWNALIPKLHERHADLRIYGWKQQRNVRHDPAHSHRSCSGRVHAMTWGVGPENALFESGRETERYIRSVVQKIA